MKSESQNTKQIQLEKKSDVPDHVWINNHNPRWAEAGILHKGHTGGSENLRRQQYLWKIHF